MDAPGEESIRELNDLCEQCFWLVGENSSQVVSLTEQANTKQRTIITEARHRDGIGQEEIKRLLTLEEVVEKENRRPAQEKNQNSGEVQRLVAVGKEVRQALGNAVDQDPPPNALSQERCAELQKRLQQLESHSNIVERRVERRNVRLNLLKAIAPLQVIGSGEDVVKGFVAGPSDVSNFSVQRRSQSTVEPTKMLWSKVHEVCHD